MILAMRRRIVLQDQAMAPTARLAVVLMIAPEARAAATQPRLVITPESRRNQRTARIHTSFSRPWTGPGSLRVVTALEIEAAMEVLVVVVAVAQTVEAAGIAALAARQA